MQNFHCSPVYLAVDGQTIVASAQYDKNGIIHIKLNIFFSLHCEQDLLF